MRWFVRHNSIDQAMKAGDLDLALQHWRHQHKESRTPGAQRRLALALMRRAESAISREDLVGAWEDLTQATEVAPTEQRDELSRRSHRLVELTIDTARTQLLAGQPHRAGQLLELLEQRQVLDWRADQIREAIRNFEQAESRAAAGDFEQAVEHLKTAHRRQPEWTTILQRIDALERSRAQVIELTGELQSAALESRWVEVDQLSRQLLEIAPCHEIARAARSHARQQMQRPTQPGLRRTQVPSSLSDSNSFFQLDPPASKAPQANIPLGGTSACRPDQFLLWVDGVGGFLVCLEPVVLIGQAHPSSEVAIGLQGDLRKRHARLERIEGRHRVHPLGPVWLDQQPRTEPFVLEDGQCLGLGSGVQLRYRQSHPLSKTARLDFVSRHRTYPWSDAILLATQAVIAGPDPRNHIVCPDWSGNVILFHREGNWFCRAEVPFQVDQGPPQTEAAIDFRSQIVGESFSLTLEPVTRMGA